jgi:hypothetical protein
MGDDRKSNGDIPGEQRQPFARDRHAHASLQQADDLYHIMHMGGKGVIADRAGKHIFRALFIKYRTHALPPSSWNDFT